MSDARRTTGIVVLAAVAVAACSLRDLDQYETQTVGVGGTDASAGTGGQSADASEASLGGTSGSGGQLPEASSEDGPAGQDGELDATQEGGSAGQGGAIDAAQEDGVAGQGGEIVEAGETGLQDSGDSGTDPYLGGPCSTTGELACNGHAQKTLLLCEGGVWKSNGVCSGNQFCDTSPGSTKGTCQDAVIACLLAQPGEAVCQDLEVIVCGPDLVTSTHQDTCSYVCLSGACTGVCLPTSKQCSGNTPQTCSSTGEWQSAAECSGTAPLCCKGACEATFVEVAAGESHTCARKSEGTLWCWGANGFGQLGEGSTTASLTPKQVSTSALGNATALFSGNDFNCALANSVLWCWGSGTQGQLADGIWCPSGGYCSTHQSLPVKVAIPGDNLTYAATGFEHVCARNTAGALWCWGFNDAGQVGVAPVGNGIPSPSQIVPETGKTVSRVAAGRSHSCAILNDSRLMCWGDNNEGELGNNGAPPSVPLGAVEVASLGASVVEVSLGWYFSCARTNDSKLYCWGSSSEGRLGIGPEAGTHELVPQEVTPLGTNVAAICTGYAHACARLNNGSLWCWGRNQSGQLGKGPPLTAEYSPVEITSLGTDVAQVSCGRHHTCALKNNGALYCWGENYDGQLGDGTSGSPKPTPIKVSTSACL